MTQVISEECAGGAMHQEGTQEEVPVPLQHHLTTAGVLADRRGDVQAVLQKAGRRFFCGHTEEIKKPVPPRLPGVFAVDFQCLDHSLLRKAQLAIK